MARTRCPKTGRFNRFELTDDGTMDTVVKCSQCGQESRFNWDGPADDEDGIPSDDDAAEQYNAWVSECCADAAEMHETDGPEV